MVTSWSCHAFFCGTTQAQTQKIEYAYFERREKCLRVVRNASFLLFLHFKIETFDKALKQILKGNIHKYFACYIILQLFKTTLRPNQLSLYLNFCSLSSTKPLLASVWISNLCFESQNHVFAMHIIAPFFPIF